MQHDGLCTDTDITEELALLSGWLSAADEPAAPSGSDRLAKGAIAVGTLIPTVLGAIAAGAVEADAPPTPAPLPEVRPGATEASVIVPIQRVPFVPLTDEHKPMVQLRPAPAFVLAPRFKAMMASHRGVTVTSGKAATATLYRVAAGDSLYAIAARVLGHGNRWRELYDANRDKLRSPSLLRIGQLLTVPGAGAASTAASTYHVARGDSLYTIAGRTLKNPARWREIASLNRARLKGGTVIYPHQVLLLPTV